MRAPRGMETKPKAREMPHSRPLIRVTWNAAPPTNTMRTCTAISAIRLDRLIDNNRDQLTNERDGNEIPVFCDAFKDIKLPV
jgi:hypothetical protein